MKPDYMGKTRIKTEDGTRRRVNVIISLSQSVERTLSASPLSSSSGGAMEVDNNGILSHQ